MISLTPTLSLDAVDTTYLQQNYLLGLTFVDANNNPYPNSFYETKIQNAVSQFENYTQVSITPIQITGESHDFHAADYRSFCLLQLNHYPILVNQQNPTPVVSVQFPTQELPSMFPEDWVRPDIARGQLRLVPTSGTIAQVIFTLGSQWLVPVGGTYFPQLWSVTYSAGFDQDKVPRLFVDAICKLAAIEVLSVLASSVYPPGIASQSIGVDGMSNSRSINQGQDTAPVFSGTIKQYKYDLFGNPQMKKDGLLDDIKSSYRGLMMVGM